MFDTLTNTFATLEGVTGRSFEYAKARDAEYLRWYAARIEQNDESHLSTCGTCSAVSAMYESAYAEHQDHSALGRIAEWETELLQGVDTAEIARRDSEAALRQAELLGASADQRAKLRTIVEERLAAQKRAAELSEQVATLQAQLDAPITDPKDRRVWGIFGKAATEANEQGYCSTYEQISEAVGIPSRNELADAGYLELPSYDVRVAVTWTTYETVTISAKNADEAVEQVDEMSDRDLWEYLDASSIDLDLGSMDSHDAREAERVSE